MKLLLPINAVCNHPWPQMHNTRCMVLCVDHVHQWMNNGHRLVLLNDCLPAKCFRVFWGKMFPTPEVLVLGIRLCGLWINEISFYILLALTPTVLKYIIIATFVHLHIKHLFVELMLLCLCTGINYKQVDSHWLLTMCLLQPNLLFDNL